MAYQNDSVIAAEFQAIQASLKLCGINLVAQAGVRRHVLHPPRNPVDEQQAGHI